MSASKSTGWIIWVILAGLAGGGFYFWKGRQGASKGPEYKTSIVSKGDIIQPVTANGQLVPVRTVQVGSQVSGIIKELRVDFNSKVKAGDIIAQIDPATLEANVLKAEADLKNAKAQLELAQLTHRRTKELSDKELVAPSELDKAVADLHQAEATVSIREATVKSVRVDLERATIYAPIDGIVISRAVDVGQTVAASFSTPTLFQIANDLSKMQIEAMVSEADVGGVEVNQPVTFTVDAFPNRTFHGRVQQVRFNAITNQNVVSYLAIVEVANDDLKLRPGMTAYPRIITAERKGVVRIPNAALLFKPPQGANIKDSGSKTNSVGTNTVAAAAGADGPPGGGAPMGEGGQPPSREEMRKRFEAMTPEQREAARARFAGGGGPGGGRGGFGGGRQRPEGPVSATLYLVDPSMGTNTTGNVLIKPVTVKTGISDGTYTEVLEGLKEGDVLVTRAIVAEAAKSATPQGGSPFGGGGFGGGRPR